VRICTTPQAVVQPVAEHTLALILAAVKGIPAYDAAMRRGDHAVRAGMQLFGKTVGIIGLGRIGYRVASLLDALGCGILFFDTIPVRDVPAAWRQAESIEQLLGTADIVSLHAGAQQDGCPILTGERFRKSKHGIVIINTARGSLIDEDAMVLALKDGTVAAAGLDVFRTEPYSGPLLAFPQVVVTPHVASNTRESRGEMELEAVHSLLAALGEMKG
jgi:D-3-phosphoglycerate dehydrogenase